jgi:serine/threonine protein kinase
MVTDPDNPTVPPSDPGDATVPLPAMFAPPQPAPETGFERAVASERARRVQAALSHCAHPSPPAAPRVARPAGAARVPSTSVEEWAAGDVIVSRYELRERVGEGGMGVVFAAHDRLAGRVIAIKRLTPALALNVDARARFRREAAATRDLMHPCIVRVFGVESDGRVDFMTMELLQGETLSARTSAMRAQRMRYSLHEVRRVAKAVCRALNFAHRTLVHRDIKPSNVFLCSDGAIKLMDFGIALHERTGTQTGTGDRIGTAQYMAPEQRRSAKIADARADQYALAVILYELLTGELPHYQSQRAHLVRNDIDERVSLVLERALQPSPAERYADISCFERALDAAWDGEDAACDSSVFTWRRPFALPRRAWVSAALFSAALTVLAVTLLPGTEPGTSADDRQRTSDSDTGPRAGDVENPSERPGSARPAPEQRADPTVERPAVEPAPPGAGAWSHDEPMLPRSPHAAPSVEQPAPAERTAHSAERAERDAQQTVETLTAGARLSPPDADLPVGDPSHADRARSDAAALDENGAAAGAEPQVSITARAEESEPVAQSEVALAPEPRDPPLASPSAPSAPAGAPTPAAPATPDLVRPALQPRSYENRAPQPRTDRTPEQLERIDDFLRRAQSGDRAAWLVETILARDGGLDVPFDDDGSTALILLAEAGNWKVAQRLIERGADFDRRLRSSGRSFLHVAALHERAEFLREVCADLGGLERNGSSAIDAADVDRRSALHVAMFEANAETALALLDRGASLRLPDRFGRTPLHRLASSDRRSAVDVLRALAARGHLTRADLTATDRLGMTPSEIARAKQRLETAAELARLESQLFRP